VLVDTTIDRWDASGNSSAHLLPWALVICQSRVVRVRLIDTWAAQHTCCHEGSLEGRHQRACGCGEGEGEGQLDRGQAPAQHDCCRDPFLTVLSALRAASTSNPAQQGAIAALLIHQPTHPHHTPTPLYLPCSAHLRWQRAVGLALHNADPWASRRIHKLQMELVSRYR
jgi:hypothetical protein